MKIRCWGARGSPPVAPAARDRREKIAAAFLAAPGVRLDARDDIERFVARQLGFDIAGTCGGHSGCVELQPAGDARVIFFDAMYSLADAIGVKEDWGHSSNIVSVELCREARAKRLAMFHREPTYSDRQIDGVLEETRRFEEAARGGH